MTFTIVARDPQTKALGVCLATGALGVAARCPQVRGGLIALSSQCYTDWRLGYRSVELAAAGKAPEEIISTLTDENPTFQDYRQVGIVSIDGKAAAHSPLKGKDYTGHRIGDGFVAMGNVLSGPQVVAAMYDTYIRETGCIFEERLLRTLEAGFHAGGERNGQMSAGLIVAMPNVQRPRTELRIDMATPTTAEGGDAVGDLRRVYNAYEPLIPYYDQFWLNNPQVGWREYLDGLRVRVGTAHGRTHRPPHAPCSHS